MRWLWWQRPHHDEHERELLRRAKAQAMKGLADADARWPAVEQATRERAERVSRNHIGELLENALRPAPNRRDGDA